MAFQMLQTLWERVNRRKEREGGNSDQTKNEKTREELRVEVYEVMKEIMISKEFTGQLAGQITVAIEEHYETITREAITEPDNLPSLSTNAVTTAVITKLDNLPSLITNAVDATVDHTLDATSTPGNLAAAIADKVPRPSTANNSAVADKWNERSWDPIRASTVRQTIEINHQDDQDDFEQFQKIPSAKRVASRSPERAEQKRRRISISPDFDGSSSSPRHLKGQRLFPTMDPRELGRAAAQLLANDPDMSEEPDEDVLQVIDEEEPDTSSPWQDVWIGPRRKSTKDSIPEPLKAVEDELGDVYNLIQSVDMARARVYHRTSNTKTNQGVPRVCWVAMYCMDPEWPKYAKSAPPEASSSKEESHFQSLREYWDPLWTDHHQKCPHCQWKISKSPEGTNVPCLFFIDKETIRVLW